MRSQIIITRHLGQCLPLNFNPLLFSMRSLRPHASTYLSFTTKISRCLILTPCKIFFFCYISSSEYIEKIFVLVYWKPMHTEQYLHYSSHHQTSCKESALPSFFSGAYSITTNEDDLTKRKTRMKEVVKENGYQKSIFKIFKRISNNHSLC